MLLFCVPRGGNPIGSSLVTSQFLVRTSTTDSACVTDRTEHYISGRQFFFLLCLGDHGGQLVFVPKQENQHKSHEAAESNRKQN